MNPDLRDSDTHAVDHRGEQGDLAVHLVRLDRDADVYLSRQPLAVGAGRDSSGPDRGQAVLRSTRTRLMECSPLTEKRPP